MALKELYLAYIMLFLNFVDIQEEDLYFVYLGRNSSLNGLPACNCSMNFQLN